MTETMVERVAMVEKVARAIEREIEAGIQFDGSFNLGKLARAAIEAMREPTERMAEAGAFGVDNGSAIAETCWRHMIDAALAEESPPVERGADGGAARASKGNAG